MEHPFKNYVIEDRDFPNPPQIFNSFCFNNSVRNGAKDDENRNHHRKDNGDDENRNHTDDSRIPSSDNQMIHSKEAFRHLLSFYILLHFRHMSFGIDMSLSNLKIGITESDPIYFN